MKTGTMKAGGLLLLAMALPAAGASEPSLRVRVSPAAAPCVQAAARVWETSHGVSVVLEAGALPGTEPADAFVGASVELTRVLEGGAGVLDSEVSVASIPWVLAVAATTAGRVRSLSDVGGANVEVVLLGGPAAYEARRALAESGGARVRETTVPDLLRGAAVAIVPLSLAGPGEHHPLDIRPLRVTAAVSAQAIRPETARAFVTFLGSEAGQKAFVGCGLGAPAR
jgi:hypothetical protein